MGMIRQNKEEREAAAGLPLDLGDLAARAAVLREEAHRAAEEILRQARAERERLISTAEEIGWTEGHAKGHAEGLEVGREEGKAEALAEWQRRLETLTERWEAALDDLENQRHRALREAEAGLLELGIAFASRVAKRAIELDPNPALTQLRAALERASASSVVVIRVHPEDHASVKLAMPGLVDAFSNAASATCVSDSAVGRGGCQLELAGGGSLRCDVDDQIDQLVRTITGRTRARDDADGMEHAA